jgi:adenine-specific DNA-methyltransferase
MSGTAQLFPTTEKIAPVHELPSAKEVSLPKPVKADDDAVVVCKDNLLFMQSLPDQSMKLIVTSPPYNLGKEYETKSSLDAYLDAQGETITEAVRLLHSKGSICWQIGNYVEDGEVFPLDILLYPIFKRAGLHLRNKIIWTFGHGLHCQKRLSGRYETILWFTKGDEYTFNLDEVRVPSKYPNKKHFKGPNKGKLSGNPLGKNPSDVWEIPNVKANHVEKTDHPCQFPVGLVERLVLALTDKGDAVLDPYLGVGSSAIAALKNGRKAYGCDTRSLTPSFGLGRPHFSLSAKCNGVALPWDLGIASGLS